MYQEQVQTLEGQGTGTPLSPQPFYAHTSPAYGEYRGQGVVENPDHGCSEDFGKGGLIPCHMTRVMSQGSQLVCHLVATFIASMRRQFMMLKFNLTITRIRKPYWLNYAIVGFRRVPLEKVGDFAFWHLGDSQLTVYTATLTYMHMQHTVCAPINSLFFTCITCTGSCYAFRTI